MTSFCLCDLVTKCMIIRSNTKKLCKHKTNLMENILLHYYSYAVVKYYVTQSNQLKQHVKLQYVI